MDWRRIAPSPSPSYQGTGHGVNVNVTTRRMTMLEREVRDGVDEQDRSKPGAGPKFFVVIEGVEHPWDRESITTEEIIAVGGWDPSLGAIEVDRENNERTLQPGEVIALKPGHGFGKKVRFKRG